MIEVEQQGSEIKMTSKKKDSTVCGIPVYYVDRDLCKYRAILQSFGFRHVDINWELNIDLYTLGLPHNILARPAIWLRRNVYWKFLHFMRELGFISIPVGERFCWRRHFFVITVQREK